MKPKECVNSDCTEVFYVEDSRLDLPLQCGKCITKKEKQNEKTSLLKM